MLDYDEMEGGEREELSVPDATGERRRLRLLERYRQFFMRFWIRRARSAGAISSAVYRMECGTYGTLQYSASDITVDAALILL